MADPTTPAAAAPAAAAPASVSIADPAPAAQAPAATAKTVAAPAPVPAVDAKAGDPAAAAPVADPAKAPEPAKSAEPAKAAPAELSLKLPDGFQADAKALDAFKATAKELGLQSDSAQKVFDLYVKSQVDAAAAAQAAQTERVKQWAETVRADKDIGGANLEASLVHARRAVEAAGGEELRKAMNELGIGNHPLVVKAFAKLGRALGEDSVAMENRPANGVASRQQRLASFYDDMK